MGGGLENLEELVFDGFNIDWGIDNLEEPEKEAEEDDFDVEAELNKPAKSKLGDIYQLGNHRVMCGDSTSPRDVEKLMNGEEADLILTDPPYNVNYESKAGTIANDNLTEEGFYAFILSAFNNMFIHTKKGGVVYVFHSDTGGNSFRQAFKECGYKLSECLIWVKNSFVLAMQDYHWRHEPILYGWKEGEGHYFIDDRSQDTVFEDKVDVNALSKEELKDMVKKLLEDRESTTVLHEDKPTNNEEHPTMKPVKLLSRLIRNSTRNTPKKPELVVDLFGGSGSTLIACEQLGRKCNMMEFDPKYCDVIIKRWETLTGNKAVKING